MSHYLYLETRVKVVLLHQFVLGLTICYAFWIYMDKNICHLIYFSPQPIIMLF